MTVTDSASVAPQPDGAQTAPVPPVSTLHEMYRTMVRIRRFEERVVADYLARKIAGFTHSYIGEEAVATGVCSVLHPDDYVTSTHRGHGHAIAKGVTLNAMMAELYGKATGVCGGRGGSMHIADFGRGMLGANGIVGGGFGIAAGAGLSTVFRDSGQVTVCFFGDGGINKGSFHEALNFAAVRGLPVVYVCENNQFAQYTAAERMMSVEDLSLRAVAYGIPGRRVDGNDVLAVRSAAVELVSRARAGEGTSLLICETYRFLGHSVGDAEAYRTKEEVAARRLLDPIPRFEAWLTGRALLDDGQRQAVWAAVDAEVDEAAAFAEASPDPDPATATDDLFANSRASWSVS